jgi:hypothetical protein
MSEDDAEKVVLANFVEIVETIEKLCLVVDQHDEEIKELHMILDSHNEIAMHLIKGKKHGKIH